MTKLFTIMIAAFLLGCGGGGGSNDDGSTDVTQEDTAAEHATDPADDPAPDAEPDATTDAEPDPSDDPADEGPTDPPDDWTVDTSSSCAAAGGFCTAERWDMCPPGYEPTTPDLVLDCGGMCCVTAPHSPCSESPDANCVGGESCPSCWEDRSDAFACEEGRICCQYTCE
jgi:hypothetical protein